MAQVTLRYDMRRAPMSTVTHADLYKACLEQCAWADERGFASVVLSEHHGTEDGFLPSPIVLAAAIAARTSRIQVNISALLVPLHDPVRLAEDLAVLDLVSAGRLSFVVGLGYRTEEYAIFGVDRSQRGRIVEEHIEVMRRAWTGEPFVRNGATVMVRPTPVQEPHPLMMYGGSVPAAATRAARLRLPFSPAHGDPELIQCYYDEARAQAFEEGWAFHPTSRQVVHVTNDPDEAWATIAPYAVYDARSYASWQEADQSLGFVLDEFTPEAVRNSGVYSVVTPDECVQLAQDAGDEGWLLLHPLMGGISPDLAWESLELFASEVLPRIQ